MFRTLWSPDASGVVHGVLAAAVTAMEIIKIE
jgi:hypothetical protein